MDIVITGFKTKEDVEKTLARLEKNTKYTWENGEKPKAYTNWINHFTGCQERGGFVLVLSNNIKLNLLQYGFGDFYSDKGEEIELINFKDILSGKRKVNQ